MPYNETFEKLKAAQNPAFAEEIAAVKDNQTFFIGAYESSSEGNIPKGDFNEIFQALLNNDKALKKLAEAIQARTITAGKGLQGGGALSKAVTLNVVSANDAIIVNDSNIQLNPVNNLTTGGTTKALSGEMGKKLNTDKQNKTDSGLQTSSKEIVGAINESLWSIGYKALSTVNDFNALTQSGVFYGKAEVGTLNTPFTPPFNFILINYNHGDLIEQTVITSVDDIVVRRQLGTRWGNWEKTLRTNTKEFLGNAGVSSIIYIQDKGTKTLGRGYIDKGTGQIYLCLETNTDTTITSKFMSITNVALGKKIDSGFWKLNPKRVGNSTTPTDLNAIVENGFYTSNSSAYKWLNLPPGFPNAFELTVTGIGGTDPKLFRTQTIKAYNSNSMWIRSDITKEANGWGAWTKIVSGTDIVDNLTTADKSKALSANMGKYLSERRVDYINLNYTSTVSYYVKLCRIKNNNSTSFSPTSRVGLLLTGMNDYGSHGGNVPLMYFSCGLRGNDLDKPLNNKVIKCTLLSDTEMGKDGSEVYFVAKKDDNNTYIDFYIKLSNYTSNGLCISKVNTSYKYDNVETTFPNDILDYNTYKSKIESGNYVKVYPYRVVETINGSAGISSIIRIQDAGQKTAGNGYVDKTTGQLYLCKTTNSDTSVTSNFVLATNIEIAKRQHFTKKILFDKPTGHGSGAITLSDNWENYDEFIVYGSGDDVNYVGSHRFKKEDIEYAISKGQRYMIYGQANDYWLVKITAGSKTWASGDKWEDCAIFRIIGIKYGG